MKVWDLARATISQFAKAIAAEPGALAKDDVYQQIVRAIWLGEFESDGQSAISLPTALSGARRMSDGEWRSRYTDKDGLRWVGDPTSVRPCPFPSFTRAELRDAFLSFCSNGTDVDDKTFQSIAMLPVPAKGDLFRDAYLDVLLIETSEMEAWRKRRAKRPKSTPGPKEVFAWPEFEKQAISVLEEKGDFRPPAWNQAELQRRMEGWCKGRVGQSGWPSVPKRTSLAKHVRKAVAAHRANNPD